jgi:hypothetical protein
VNKRQLFHTSAASQPPELQSCAHTHTWHQSPQRARERHCAASSPNSNPHSLLSHHAPKRHRNWLETQQRAACNQAQGSCDRDPSDNWPTCWMIVTPQTPATCPLSQSSLVMLEHISSHTNRTSPCAGIPCCTPGLLPTSRSATTSSP